jgi:hypothetical protein
MALHMKVNRWQLIKIRRAPQQHWRRQSLIPRETFHAGRAGWESKYWLMMDGTTNVSNLGRITFGSTLIVFLVE